MLRNVGVPMGHSLIAFQSTLKGLRKLILNEEKIAADLDNTWAVVAEAIQTILRREAYPHPYEALKALTRTNKKMDEQTIHEFIQGLDVSDIVKADIFAEGDKVDVVGTSKGKGYQGVIKRYGQHRLRETHGTGPVARHAGSNGSTSTPSRVFKGKKLPGHMGAVRVTVQNLSVVKIDAENNLIAIKGAIPGPKGAVVTIHNSVKA